MIFGLVLGLLSGLSACLPEPLPDAEWVAAEDISGPLALDLDLNSRNAQPGSRLRVVTFNVLYGDDLPALVAAIRGNSELAAADVFLIQEIESYPDEGESRSATLARELDMNYAYAPAREEGTGTHGLAILSRFALDRVEVMRLPRFEMRYNSRDRIALAADILLGEEALRVVDVHLDTRLNITQRVIQLNPAVTRSDER
ncbi:MAG: endonuclease/exonuclease/phosphatase family protein, partial [Myxococcota bacterium]